MDRASRDEDERACLYFLTTFSIKKESMPASYEINLVARVGLLRIMPDWSV